jgi:hypothetical protein
MLIVYLYSLVFDLTLELYSWATHRMTTTSNVHDRSQIYKKETLDLKRGKMGVYDFVDSVLFLVFICSPLHESRISLDLLSAIRNTLSANCYPLYSFATPVYLFFLNLRNC